MHPFVNTAIKAARQAGEVIMRAQEQLDQIEIAAKSKNNFVTNVDQAAEYEIIQILQKAYPNHAILGEESGEIVVDNSEYQWIIDPLDGTTNFIHGYPHFCVSIALKHKGRIEHAVIYDPIKQDIYAASRGEGARKNDRRIRVSRTNLLEEAMVAMGLPPSAHQYKEQVFNAVQHLSGQIRSMRLAGSAALDLAYVAAGQLDAYWSLSLAPWDVAAGSLLIREAGGHCMDFKGSEDFLDSGHILAGNIKLIKPLLEQLRAHLPERITRS